MSFRRRVAVSVLLLGVGVSAFSPSGVSWIPSAHAQGIVRNLIARLRGQTLPDGVVKSNGRIEATQLDVSSKYASRLSEVTVDEGHSVTKGQVIAKLTSPEYEAQLRAAQANVQNANNALTAAEAVHFAPEPVGILQDRFCSRAGTDQDRVHHQTIF